MLSFYRSRARRIAAGGAFVALAVAAALLSGTVHIGPDTSSASARLRQAAAERPATAADELAWRSQERVRLLPDDIEAQALLGAAYLQLARETGDPSYYPRAEEALNAAIRLDPQNIQAIVGLGSLALSRHEFAGALDLGERALAINKNVPRVYGVIGDAQVELGLYDEALTTIQTMVDLRPDLASLSRVSYLRELHGNLDGAMEAMAAAVEARGPAPENTEYLRTQLGLLYLAAGNLAAAERTFERSLAVLPDFVPALGGLARLRTAQGRTSDAIALYEEATARLPLPELVIGLGETLEAAGQQVEADEQYALVAAMSQLYAANGVRTDLEMAGFFADHGDDPQEALGLARAAYEAQPNVRAADTLAWALHRSGESAAAWPLVEEGLRLGTRDARIHYHAGVIAQALGRTDVAREHLTDALAANPQFHPLDAPRAAAALDSLEVTP